MIGSAADAETIKYFDTVVRVKKDSTVLVTESIFIDFEKVDRHGFTRIIPLTYHRAGGAYTAGFKLLQVTENLADREDVPVKSRVIKHEDAVNVTIGDVHIPVTGRHVYKLTYVLRNGVNYFEGLPELFYSMNGGELAVPVENAKVSVYPPDGTPPTAIAMDAYIGEPGNKASVEMRVDNSFALYTAQNLKPGEEFFISAGFPKGSVAPPSVFKELVFWFFDWWPAVAIPLGTALSIWVVWWHYGRDAANPDAVTASWNPPTEMTPAEVGTLYDERCDMQDMVATLIDLAARGHLKIREIPRTTSQALGKCDYLFVRTQAPSDDLPLRSYEKNFLAAIFAVSTETRLSQLKDKFYDKIPDIRDGIYDALAQEGYFQHNPETVRKSYRGLAIFFCLLGMLFILASSADSMLTPVGLGLVVCAAIVGTFAFAMPARTEKGIAALRQALGFAMFIERSESRRTGLIVNEDREIFGRLLPYAIVLGAADKWAEDFVAVIKEPPSWYEYADTGEFSPMQFVADLGSGMKIIEATMVSEPPGAGTTLSIGSS